MWLLLLVAAVTLLFLWLKYNFTYWQRKGFPYVEPKIPWGILDSVRRRERSLGMAICDVHTTRKEPFVGIYMGTRHALLIRDAQFARNILSKDFSSFHDRGVYVDEKKDPMSGGIFFLKGRKWKTLRTKLTPSFTSGKLKAMFPTVLDVSNKMLNYLNEVMPANGSKQLELKSFFAIYSIDIIASVIFGLEVDSFKDPTNEFYMLSKKINEPTFGSVIRGTCQFLYPGLEKIFVALGWKEKSREVMKKIVRSTVEYREKNNITRKDMLQMLLQIRNTGKINADDDVWTAETAAESLKSMSIDQIAAQLYLFYIAGFETTSTAASFTIYELAQYPEVLAKAQADVKQALEKHGELNYDAIGDMKYLDLCVMETTRKHIGLPLLNRECTEDFPIPESNLVITKGTPIVISLFGMHRDAEYFPDPLKFEPERFLEENMRHNPVAYMPFGDGPRHCIAQRMGKVIVKVALAQILSNFQIEINTEKREIEIANYGISIKPKGGVNVRLSKNLK